MTQKQQRLQKKKQDRYNNFNTQTIWKFQLKTQVQGL